jgi:hypothetical protein
MGVIPARGPDESSAARTASDTAAAQSPKAGGAVVDFTRDIRPIFEANCYRCHGESRHKSGLRLDRKSSAMEGGTSGKVIEPGDSAKSALVQRVTATDPDERMPQGKDPLGAREIALLRAWIDQGANWPDDGSSAEAGEKHWAYVKPVQATPPEIPGVSHPIDRFVRARLAKEGLSPSPPADRATLLRRVSIDVTGLPPTLEEIDAFVRDERPDAYERVVDRLLASPRYGERAAQRWLDLARYADTNGYEKDERRTMWRYRDWVIDAYNRNMPFDLFTIEQIAGDLLPSATLDQKIASGFHRNSLMNEEGGIDPEEFRNAAVVDRVNTTASVWLGTTLACAQCHNHKFDPFSQKEYYQLFAFFDSTADTGNKNDPMISAPTPEQARDEARLAAEVGGLEKELAGPDTALDAEEAMWAASARRELPAATDWRVLAPLEANAKNESALTVQPEGFVLAGGKLPDRETYTITAAAPLERVRVLRLEVAKHDSLPAHGPGRAANGNFVLTDLALDLVDGDKSVRVPIRAAEASYEQDQGGRFRVGAAIDADASSGWAIDRGGNVTRAETALFALDRPLDVPRTAKLRVTLACESAFAQHVLGDFRLSVADDEALARRVAPPEMGAWRLVGPFFAKSQADALATVFPPEKEITTHAPPLDQYEVPLSPEQLAVEQASSDSPVHKSSFFAWIGQGGWRDGEVHTLDGEKCAQYVSRDVHCDEPASLALYVGADDALRLWIDGEQRFEAKEMQGGVVDQHRVDVKLARGDHTIAMKIVNGAGQYSFFFDAVRTNEDRMPESVAAALRAEPPTEPQRAAVRDYFRRTQSPRGRELAARLAKAEKDLADLRARIPTALVMKELDKPRVTHVHVRGSFMNLGDEVEPGVPRVLNPLRSRSGARTGDSSPSSDPKHDASSSATASRVDDGAPSPPAPRATRLDLARWLVDPENPLTARVVVNRVWMELFGRGIVATENDFGTRGDPPTHPELLDWLAVELVRTKWDMKGLMRTIVTSETYRQSSNVTPEMLERDPKNVWLERFPRQRMEIETLRDVSLAIGGLLHEKTGGPSVMPPQPDGIWSAAYSGDKWTDAMDGDRFRRGLYTFWRRSSPYATYTLFDAPSRELACTRRAQTNTPLQALALLNDPAFVECAAGLASRMMHGTNGSDAEKIALGFRLCTAREPSLEEVDVLAKLRMKEYVRLANSPESAKKTVASAAAGAKADEHADPIELASWIAVGNVLLNLDETVTRN